MIVEDMIVDCCILIFLGLVHVHTADSKTIFISVCTPLIAICFGVTIQLVCSDPLLGHSSRSAGAVGHEEEGG